jgi:crotonobetainyl-CoA:carnitine CoA-transferase CaiB-like acyl-CoA transferase
VHVPYNTFHCSDGFIVIAVITDNFWQNLKQLVQSPAFEDEKYDTQPGRWEDRDMIDAKLNEILANNTCRYWLDRLEAARIPCAPVNNLDQALSDEQVLHRNMIVELKHPSGKSTKGPGNPIKLSRSGDESFSPAPLLGQHTSEVFTKLLDYSIGSIEALKTAGAIA